MTEFNDERGGHYENEDAPPLSNDSKEWLAAKFKQARRFGRHVHQPNEYGELE